VLLTSSYKSGVARTLSSGPTNLLGWLTALRETHIYWLITKDKGYR
jgi:hypothetical protein